MLPSDMNLRIGNVRNYNNKILISSLGFKIGTNLNINLDGEKDKPDVKSKEVEMVKTEPKVITKPNTKPNKEHKQDLTSSSNRMLRNLIRIRSPMRKKRLL